MKLKATMVVCLCLVNFLHAAVITVDNNANSGAMYTDIQPAIDNASNGDTIYVSGSLTAYSNSVSLYLNKRLTLVGAGYNPQKQVPLSSQIGGSLFLDSIASVSGASGSIITGFYLPGGIYDNYGAKNVIIERNNLASAGLTASADNYLIKNNVIGSLSIGDASNIIVTNNALNYISSSSQPSVIIKNNVFAYSSYMLSTVSFAIIENNIFTGYFSSDPIAYSVSNCTFNKNLCYETADVALPPAGNMGSGNFANANPLFVYAPSLHYIDINFDYHLQNASPGHNAGTDGTDLGIYGGSYPMPAFSGEPRIPQMKELNINNSVVAPNGLLNVIFKAKKAN